MKHRPWELIMPTSNQLVAGCSISPLKAGRACPLLLLAGFVRFSSTSFRTHTVGQTGSRTVA